MDKFCENCGYKLNANDKFCEKCGSKIEEKDKPKKATLIENNMGENYMPNYCSNCGNKLDGNEIFCTNCGFKIIDYDISATNNYENNQDHDVKQESENKKDTFDNKHSRGIRGLFNKIKEKDKEIQRKGAIIDYEKMKKGMVSGDRRFFNKIEPEFVEVYDNIDDTLVKALLYKKRCIMLRSGNSFSTAVSLHQTPTKALPHDKAIKYYEDMANMFAIEIYNERKKGDFDEEEFWIRKTDEFREERLNAGVMTSLSMEEYDKNRRKQENEGD